MMRIFAGLLAGLLLVAGSAAAHSKKQSTWPEDGATVTGAPEKISMDFDKPILITMFRVIGPGGEEVDVERQDGMQPVHKFEATPEAMAPGAYEIIWRGLSSDGHPVEGEFAFTVN